jgi:hypothetical protein
MLVSIITATDKGSVSIEILRISCGRPSSKIRKFSCLKLSTKFPLESRTETGTTTTSTCARMVSFCASTGRKSRSIKHWYQANEWLFHEFGGALSSNYAWRTASIGSVFSHGLAEIYAITNDRISIPVLRGMITLHSIGLIP